MRVPIRWKALTLFLSVALVPLILVSFLDLRITSHLGGELARTTQDALMRNVQVRLEQWIAEKSCWLRERRKFLEQTLRLQAQQVERAIASTPGKSKVVYFTEQFDGAHPLPPGSAPSERHLFYSPNGEAHPLEVTYDHQALYLVPGVTRAKVEADIGRLSQLSLSYRDVFRSAPEPLFWQYTALESGLSSVYPGHGNHPAGFDPRQREWYLRTKEAGKMMWYGPYLDASARETILTLSAPLRKPDGSFAGVTGIDFKVADFSSELQLPAGWPQSSTAMLVSLDPHEGSPRLRILTRPGYGALSRNSGVFEEQYVESTHPDFPAVLSEMTAGKSGLKIIPYNGKPSLWAYGALEPSLFLLAILPHQEVMREAISAHEQTLRHTQEQQDLAKWTLLGVAAVIVAVAFRVSYSITQPIRELASATRAVAGGDFQTRVRVQSHDELGDLGEAFNRMVPQLQDRIRIKQSLDLAREVQQNLLPAKSPKVEGFDLAGMSIYCDETGGDYYDFLEFTREGGAHLGIIIGDVTGHGIAAAMLMATARSLLRTHAPVCPSLSEMMTRVNQQLSTDVSGGRFMTVFFLHLDVSKRNVRWASAGHDPALKYNPRTESFDELGDNSPPFGIDPTQIYDQRGPKELESGEVIVIATDGVWESRNHQGERFGKDRLREVIRASSGRSSADIALAIRNAVTAFRNGHPQEDDITLIVVKTLA